MKPHDGHGACRVCGWRIARGGLDRCCMRCARAVGVLPPRPVSFKDADLAVPVHPSQRIPSHWQERRPAIPRVIEGREYLVMWDGS
jgi:hypothetical protein